jgi:hypothetical protein
MIPLYFNKLYYIIQAPAKVEVFDHPYNKEEQKKYYESILALVKE